MAVVSDPPWTRLAEVDEKRSATAADRDQIALAQPEGPRTRYAGRRIRPRIQRRSRRSTATCSYRARNEDPRAGARHGTRRGHAGHRWLAPREERFGRSASSIHAGWPFAEPPRHRTHRGCRSTTADQETHARCRIRSCCRRHLRSVQVPRGTGRHRIHSGCNPRECRRFPGRCDQARRARPSEPIAVQASGRRPYRIDEVDAEACPRQAKARRQLSGPERHPKAWSQ